MGGDSVAEEAAFGCVAGGLVCDVAGGEAHEVFHDEEGSLVAHLVEASPVAVAVIVFGFLCLEPGFPFLCCAPPAHVHNGWGWEGGVGWRVGGFVCCGAFWAAEFVGVDEYAVATVGESCLVGFGSRPAGGVSGVPELLVDGVGVLFGLGDVFDDDFGGLYGSDDVHATVEEAAAGAVESGLFSGAGEVLAGEAEGDGVALVVEECGVTDVIVDGGCWVVVCEDLACWLVVVAYGVDGLWAECGLDGEF